MTADLSIRCANPRSDEFTRIEALAIINIFIYPIGVVSQGCDGVPVPVPVPVLAPLPVPVPVAAAPSLLPRALPLSCPPRWMPGLT